jgi:hypothetical protein
LIGVAVLLFIANGAKAKTISLPLNDTAIVPSD